jgi:uncharacterized RDD family membrane protein YckC
MMPHNVQAPGERRSPAMVAEPDRAPVDVRPHAYNPVTNPELFEGVLACRVFAFVIDIIIVALPVMGAGLFILLLGIVTFGLGWLLFWPLHILSVIWAVLYYGFTLGGPASATIGMRVMEIELRTWYGAPCYFVLGGAHAIVFWISVSVLTPLILVIGLFNDRRRLLHDMVLGTVVINNPTRAARFARR